MEGTSGWKRRLDERDIQMEGTAPTSRLLLTGSFMFVARFYARERGRIARGSHQDQPDGNARRSHQDQPDGNMLKH
nr:hypothetical protein [Tanacetum cinerariifolium]